MSRDADLLRDAHHVITGERDTGQHNVTYAIYVAVIAAASYGVPAAQAFFRFLDPRWLATHLAGYRGVVLAMALLVATVAFVFRAGRVRGPVVPDLPYLDHVATSPLDRAVVLRRWWRIALLGCIVGGVLIGLVSGAGLAIAALAGAVILGPSVVAGGLVGLLVAGAWLHGQVRAWPVCTRRVAVLLRPGQALRALHLTALRTQSARSVTLGGAVLAGDLRAARLDIAAPITRGRAIRLRARGPVSTLVWRDWLGLRRAPGRGVLGLVLTVAGVYGLVHAATPGTPSLIAVVSLVVAYFGVGAWSEGLRLHGDNAGTPPLLGLGPMAEAGAHLVVPGVLSVLTVCGVGLTTALSARGSFLGMLWAILLLGLLLAGQVMAAYRGLPPIGVFSPRGGMPAMVAWQSVPLVVPVICGTAATAGLTSRQPVNGLLVLAVTTWLVALYARRRVRLLFDAHRG